MPDPHNTTVLYISITTVSLSDFSREDSEHIMIVQYEQSVVYTQNTTIGLLHVCAPSDTIRRNVQYCH